MSWFNPISWISSTPSSPQEDDSQAPIVIKQESKYSQRFNDFIPFIFKWECDWPNDKSGQYSNDPDDPGGPTKFGVDLKSAKLDHPNWTSKDIKSLTYEQAVDIYWNDYWKRFNVETHPYPLGETYFNSKQNGGHPDTWINQCDNNAKKFIDLQEQYYRDLCAYWSKEGKHDPYKYLPGWLNRTSDLLKYLKIV